MAKNKYVYMFSEGNATMRETLGGKGANLCEMTRIGLPVPEGFIVSTGACVDYYKNNKKIDLQVEKEILKCLEKLEKKTGNKLGDCYNPLLLSIRSGARVSMPGMMDSVLNLGLNDEVVGGLARLAGNLRFAYDSYRRFIQMYSEVVMGLDMSKFEQMIDEIKMRKGVTLDTELDADDLKALTDMFKQFYKSQLKEDFPQDPKLQLINAITAVFKSWNNARAIAYRKMNDIPDDWGTAVNVQRMVYGNMGEKSGTGVAFSRDPAIGENKVYGEFLINAQGEDIVSGARTPQPISKLKKFNSKIYDEFEKYIKTLERHYKDMQEVEFTIENEKLFMLQTRSGKRTVNAALKIAVDMVNEKLITEKDAVMMVEPKQLDLLLHPQFATKALRTNKPLAKGLPASPGASCGKIALSASKVEEFKKNKQKCVLVRLETSPEDVESIHYAEGVLTARGGITSHAAVISRGIGTACVAGCNELSINMEAGYITIAGKKFKEGDVISFDGTTGNIYEIELETEPAKISGDFATFMNWADKYSAMEVRANADNPKDAKTAYNFGAKGVGLVRTEHMFFGENRIFAMREMIISDTQEQRTAALKKLLPMQKKDFVGIFKAMDGLPVTIRLLDPPLHEFLPKTEDDIKALAKDMGIAAEFLKDKVNSLHEFNPMMGHRGLRLAVTYPEIAKMQTRAIIEAGIKVKKDENLNIIPEIMIPLTCETKEYEYVKDIVQKEADLIISKSDVKIDYSIGTMIETPRACLIADEISKSAEFFSFGTNDLTQLTFGFSRDDSGKFLNSYYEKNLLANDPFERLDTNGVGKLVEIAISLGKQTRKDIKLGICGEHGGEPATVDYCHRVGLTYVSCSPYRVPIARLAASQANIKHPRK